MANHSRPIYEDITNVLFEFRFILTLPNDTACSKGKSTEDCQRAASVSPLQSSSSSISSVAQQRMIQRAALRRALENGQPTCGETQGIQETVQALAWVPSCGHSVSGAKCGAHEIH